MIEARFDYAGPFKSLTRADEVLSDLYNQGWVCDGENPLIEGRKVRGDGKTVVRYFITLPL